MLQTRNVLIRVTVKLCSFAGNENIQEMSNLTGIQLEGEWIRNVRVLHNILSYIGRSTKCNFNLEVAGHLPETTILNNLGLVTLVRINCLLQVER